MICAANARGRGRGASAIPAPLRGRLEDVARISALADALLDARLVG